MDSPGGGTGSVFEQRAEEGEGGGTVDMTSWRGVASPSSLWSSETLRLLTVVASHDSASVWALSSGLASSSRPVPRPFSRGTGTPASSRPHGKGTGERVPEGATVLDALPILGSRAGISRKACDPQAGPPPWAASRGTNVKSESADLDGRAPSWRKTPKRAAHIRLSYGILPRDGPA